MGFRSGFAGALLLSLSACGEREPAVQVARRVAMLAGETQWAGRLSGRGEVELAGLRFTDADLTHAHRVDGLQVLDEAYPSTDVVVAPSFGGAEIFYVLRDARAPKVLRFEAGRATVEVPRARDATGAAVAVSMQRQGSLVELTVNARHAVYPVLVDPVVTRLEWHEVAWGGRSTHAIAYDPNLQKTVLFGGSPGGQDVTQDTWDYDGATWKRRFPTHRPPARNNFAMVYDANRKHVVLFGGATAIASALLGDTWEWDGDDWLELTPAGSPPSRGCHAMAFDFTRNRLVLFGGSDGLTELNDTWEFDGAAWSQKMPTFSPPARISHAMAYDVSRSTLILFGGLTGSTNLPDTWTYNGLTWTQRLPGTSPPPRRDVGVRRPHLGPAHARQQLQRSGVLRHGLRCGARQDRALRRRRQHWQSQRRLGVGRHRLGEPDASQRAGAALGHGAQLHQGHAAGGALRRRHRCRHRQ